METNIPYMPLPTNEPVYSYAPGTTERTQLMSQLESMRHSTLEISMYIGDQTYTKGIRTPINPPHELKRTVGYYPFGDEECAILAVQAALQAKKKWEETPWSQKAAIFLKAADLVAGKYRYAINAGTMLVQSKSAHQAEIDAACELADFLRFNVYYAHQIYQMQPVSAPGVWNRSDYRPLEGFVYALTPFNFTAIAANLPTAPALMGNVVVWKAADAQVYTADLFMKILLEAGLPKGVINLIYGDGPALGEAIISHKLFAGLHFTGSTAVFKTLWKKIALNLDHYHSYPRIVGETGGKDFILAHPSAAPDVLITALIRGAFEFQGQKCSAASRAYIPNSLWDTLWPKMKAELDTIKVGPTHDLSCFMNAVIDRKAYTKITTYIEKARQIAGNQILYGGTYSDTEGYFIQPTVILTTDPHSLTMEEEIFGPVLTIYVYKESFQEILQLVDHTSPYALTGAIIAQDSEATQQALGALRHSAGNFYINDKCTGAVVGQQPFGGSRMSGTNDKSGSMLNLLRWVSPRTVKEVFVPPTDYRYPFLQS